MNAPWIGFIAVSAIFASNRLTQDGTIAPNDAVPSNDGVLPGVAAAGNDAVAENDPLARTVTVFAREREDDQEELVLLEAIEEVEVGRTPSGVRFGPRSGDVYVSCAYDSAIVRLDARTRASKERWRFSPMTPQAFEVLPSEREILFANYGADTICWLDLKSGEVEHELQLELKPTQIALSPKGDLAAVTCRQAQAVWFVNLRSKAAQGEPVILSGAPHGVVFDSRGSNVLVACGGPRPMMASIQVGSRARLSSLGPILEESQLCLSRDGKKAFLWSSEEPGALLQMSASGGSPETDNATQLVEKSFPIPGRVHCMRMIRAGKSIALLRSKRDELVLVDAKTFEVQQTLKTGEQPYSMAESKNRKTLAVANRSSGTVSFYSILR